jgi:hypothetical protein
MHFFDLLDPPKEGLPSGHPGSCERSLVLGVSVTPYSGPASLPRLDGSSSVPSARATRGI